MLSSLNNVNCNPVSFGNRYLILSKESMGIYPQSEKVLDAVVSCPVVKNFVEAGNPKSLIAKFIDLFKRNEYLEVSHNRQKFAEYDSVSFQLRKSFSKKCRTLFLNVDRNSVTNHPDFVPTDRKQMILSGKSNNNTEKNFIYAINSAIADNTLIRQINNMDSDFFNVFNIKRSR